MTLNWHCSKTLNHASGIQWTRRSIPRFAVCVLDFWRGKVLELDSAATKLCYKTWWHFVCFSSYLWLFYNLSPGGILRIVIISKLCLTALWITSYPLTEYIVQMDLNLNYQATNDQITDIQIWIVNWCPISLSDILTNINVIS